MAIINVTQKNFSKAISEKIDKMEAEGLLFSAFMGGKDEMKKALADMPDENLLWVNTDYVAAVSAPTRVSESGDVVFRIHFKYPESKDNPIWIKGDDYKRFILAWAGEVKTLNEGEYEVPSGYHVTIKDDGGKICIKKNED